MADGQPPPMMAPPPVGGGGVPTSQSRRGRNNRGRSRFPQVPGLVMMEPERSTVCKARVLWASSGLEQCLVGCAVAVLACASKCALVIGVWLCSLARWHGTLPRPIATYSDPCLKCKAEPARVVRTLLGGTSLLTHLIGLASWLLAGWQPRQHRWNATDASIEWDATPGMACPLPPRRDLEHHGCWMAWCGCKVVLLALRSSASSSTRATGRATCICVDSGARA
jgi:hypothetical protein